MFPLRLVTVSLTDFHLNNLLENINSDKSFCQIIVSACVKEFTLK